MNPQEYVIQIEFTDRFGLGYEILETLNSHQINLLSTEATVDKGMMIKFESRSAEKVEELMMAFRSLEGVTQVIFRHHMLWEEREHELRTILNSVSEGVIAVDKEGKVTHINSVALDTFDCAQEDIIGQKMDEFFQTPMPLLDSLKTGQAYHLKEMRFKRGTRFIHYLTSGVPILDDHGQIIGGVATMNDYQKVEDLISKVGGRKRLTTFEDIVYQSAKIRQVVETAKTVAKGKSTVMLRGESGTGKEMFAQAIHMESHRSDAPFIAINCSALPSALLESELFGYEEGAFTGAIKGGRKGLFEQATGGTLFLDEIGEISAQFQVSLLRALQEGTIRRIGGMREIPVDVRIIAATHRNLEEMIQKGEYREDLYYRLNVIPLKIPPLMEHLEDIPRLVQHLVHKVSVKLDRPEICLTMESMQLLMNKHWPGNVRQLENVLERFINTLDMNNMEVQEINEWVLHSKNQSVVCECLPERNESNIQVRMEQQAEMRNRGSLHIDIPISRKWPPLRVMMGEIEKEILKIVLEKHPTSRKAGKALGVSSTTILNKMNAYGIKSSRENEGSDEI